jgi:catechol 2,3-dioxygenase-like lactoylglutathione lyase family enzyme
MADARNETARPADASPPAQFKVDALDHLVVNVADVSVSVEWYVRVLGMTREDSDDRTGRPSRTSVTFGRQKINLRPVAASKNDWFTANQAVAGSDDLCFVTESSPGIVVEHLRACGVAVELGPVSRVGARGEMTSVYCRDPDGSLIEIATYGENG